VPPTPTMSSVHSSSSSSLSSSASGSERSHQLEESNSDEQDLSM